MADTLSLTSDRFTAVGLILDAAHDDGRAMPDNVTIYSDFTELHFRQATDVADWGRWLGSPNTVHTSSHYDRDQHRDIVITRASGTMYDQRVQAYAVETHPAHGPAEVTL